MPNDNRFQGAKEKVLYTAAEWATVAGGTYACGQCEENLLCVVIAVIIALVVASLWVPNPPPPLPKL